MSFREPLLLLGLALVPLALAAYVVAQRRRRRFAVRYTNVDVLASVAARIGWARHLPAALALLALAALVVALARPERTVAAEQNAATVVMVTDTSGSMLANDVRPDRLTAAKAAARALADELPRDFRLGLRRRLPAALLLLSDGANTTGEAVPITVAERARKLRIPVYTVALGT